MILVRSIIENEIYNSKLRCHNIELQLTQYSTQPAFVWRKSEDISMNDLPANFILIWGRKKVELYCTHTMTVIFCWMKDEWNRKSGIMGSGVQLVIRSHGLPSTFASATLLTNPTSPWFFSVSFWRLLCIIFTHDMTCSGVLFIFFLKIPIFQWSVATDVFKRARLLVWWFTLTPSWPQKENVLFTLASHQRKMRY